MNKVVLAHESVLFFPVHEAARPHEQKDVLLAKQGLWIDGLPDLLVELGHHWMQLVAVKIKVGLFAGAAGFHVKVDFADPHLVEVG